MKAKSLIRNFSLLFLSACATRSAVKDTRFDVQAQHVQVGSKIAVASDGRESARIAREIHARGGNWVDVFVATSFAISVERPQSTGIGGGGFALIHLGAEKKTYAFDFRETAPAQLVGKAAELIGPDGKRKSDLSSRNVRGSGVPGIVAGLHAIHKKWGRMSWTHLVEPAVRLADRGFPVDSLLATAIQLTKEKLLGDPSLRALYFPTPAGLKEGDLLRQPDLSATLRQIARDPGSFYSGPISRQILKFVKSGGGYLTQKDFDSYRALPKEPLKWREGPYEIVSFPSPSFGGEATQIIQSDVALRQELTEAQLVKEWVATLQRAFEFRAKRYEAASDKPQTSQISIIDGFGNAVSSTQTVNSAFGSGKMVPATGILLNDEMDDFYYENREALNHPQKMQRPLSSMAPTLVLQDSKVRVAIGSQGGRRLMSCMNWVLVNYLWQKKTLEQAVSSPRIHLSYPAKTLVVDASTPTAWLKDFKDYKIENPPIDCRNQTVESYSGVLKSVVDPRSTGVPVAL